MDDSGQSKGQTKKNEKKNNVLPIWGNEKTMNLNPLILTNIQSSPYFKNELFKLKTYHEVIDEIYYKVAHLEPWEKGSRQTAGQTGMCGGVRGVGTGGIVSSAFCLLYKLFTLKLTRKQVNGIITHVDSPYIRALGFMYIRFTQPPADLWDWYEDYLDDEEELDVKAGTGCIMTMGEMLRCFLTKLEWFSTLFPRIPVPIMKDIERRMPPRKQPAEVDIKVKEHIPDEEVSWGEAERVSSRDREKVNPSREKDHGRDKERDIRKQRSRSPTSRHRDESHRGRSHDRRDSRGRESRRSPDHHHRSRRKEESDFASALERERERQKRDRERRRSRTPTRDHKRRRSRSPERRRSRSPEKRRHRSRSREKSHRSKESSRNRERSRSRERHDRHREKHRESERKKDRKESSKSRDHTRKRSQTPTEDRSKHNSSHKKKRRNDRYSGSPEKFNSEER